jgi:hypothetical protein
MSPLVPYTVKGEGFTFPSSGPEPDSPARQHLLYSVKNEIRLHHDYEDREYRIKKRVHQIGPLAVRKNSLFHAESGDETVKGFIFRTETGERIAERIGTVKALMPYGGYLFDAGEFGEIFSTERFERIARRGRGVNALAIYNGRLIDGSGIYIRYTQPPGGFVAEIPAPSVVGALAVHEKRLIQASNCVRDRAPLFSGEIFEVEGKKQIAQRSDWVRALASYKGCLIDAGDYCKIFYTADNEPLVEADGPINSLLPIDDEMASRLLHLKGVRKLE